MCHKNHHKVLDVNFVKCGIFPRDRLIKPSTRLAESMYLKPPGPGFSNGSSPRSSTFLDRTLAFKAYNTQYSYTTSPICLEFALALCAFTIFSFVFVVETVTTLMVQGRRMFLLNHHPCPKYNHGQVRSNVSHQRKRPFNASITRTLSWQARYVLSIRCHDINDVVSDPTSDCAQPFSSRDSKKWPQPIYQLIQQIIQTAKICTVLQ